MKKLLIPIIFSSFIILINLSPKRASASLFDDIKGGGLTDVGYTVYGSMSPQKPILQVIAEIIKYILSFLGMVFLIFILYGGFMWMTAGGNDDKVAQAKSIIINGTIGVVIILSAYAITYYILENVIKATTGMA